MRKFTSGAHIGTVRKWIQREALNGEIVEWGSDTPLKLRRPLSSAELEDLAQQIRDAVQEEISAYLPGVCGSFKPFGMNKDGIRLITLCSDCGQHELLHLPSEVKDEPEPELKTYRVLVYTRFHAQKYVEVQAPGPELAAEFAINDLYDEEEDNPEGWDIFDADQIDSLEVKEL